MVLIYATVHCSVNGIDALLAAGADVNFIDRKANETALTFAIIRNRHACVDALIKGGADVNLATSMTPLKFSVLTCMNEKANENDMMRHVRSLLRAEVHVNYLQREDSTSGLLLSITVSPSRKILLWLFAAGDRVADIHPLIPHYLKELMNPIERTLKSRCRDKIYSHLMQLSPSS